MAMTQGAVKSYNPTKGFGFVLVNGQDVFFHQKDVLGKLPQEGDVLTFKMVPSEKDPSKFDAKNVTGGTAGGANQGTVKSFNPNKGFGFIEFGGQEVFVYHADVTGGALKEGDTVWFDMEPNPKDPMKMTAKNVSGGTGGSGQGGYGKAKGKGANMMAMMAMMMGMGPYGKGMGKGGGQSTGKCFKFQQGTCTFTDCKFRHEM